MLDKAKKVVALLGGGNKPHDLSSKDVHEARQYIHDYWKRLERYHPKDDETLFGVPKPYLVPAYEAGHSFDFNELYYWDSYFMVQGFLKDKHRQKLVSGILEDLLYLQKRLKIIPNASRTYLTGRSQPPLLTSFIFDVYDSYHPGKKWLAEAIKTAETEYYTVWLGVNKPNERQIYRGLSRYYDINYLHDLAETESGWDMTPRFSRKTLNYLPIDLNSLLYKYETDFARASQIAGDHAAEESWLKRAASRKEVMDELMWSPSRDFYYDYDYVRQRRGSVSSLAGFYPMWAGMATKEQAAKMVRSLKKFEAKGGLSTTDQQFNQRLPGQLPGTGNTPTQWAYPNGWAPLQFFVIKGLERYGYHDDARRIAMKWLKTNLDWFNDEHVFLEKYNVVNPDKPPAKGVYPSQTGFGWTNAVFERLCQDYIDKRT
ncbi:MAG: Alpha,alpha-trehalase [Patescibacteria group bacterium]|nr:Alpha,alpha-trehalase [Patescibacteria group bacterium]